MALEAIQARAGHRSVETTRVYLHLAADGWLAEEYRKAIICSTEKVVDGTGISASEVISNKGTQSLSTRCRPR